VNFLWGEKEPLPHDYIRRKFHPCALAPTLKATRKKPDYYKQNDENNLDWKRWAPLRETVADINVDKEDYCIVHGFVELKCGINAETAHKIISEWLLFEPDISIRQVDLTKAIEIQPVYFPGQKAIAYMRHVEWSTPRSMYTQVKLHEGELWCLKSKGILCGIEGDDKGIRDYIYPKNPIYWSDRNKEFANKTS